MPVIPTFSQRIRWFRNLLHVNYFYLSWSFLYSGILGILVPISKFVPIDLYNFAIIFVLLPVECNQEQQSTEVTSGSFSLGRSDGMNTLDWNCPKANLMHFRDRQYSLSFIDWFGGFMWCFCHTALNYKELS